LNFEITDSSIVPLAEGSADVRFPESCTSKFKTGLRISNFRFPDLDLATIRNTIRYKNHIEICRKMKMA